jgi:hypothetical protein
MAFNCPPAAVKRALKNGLKPPKQPSRHNTWPEGSEADILTWIQHQAEKSQPSPRPEILHYCSGKFGKPSFADGWIFSEYVIKTIWQRRSTKAQEGTRLQMPRKFLLGPISGMKEAVQGHTCDLVFNLDEVGVSEDRKS